VGGNPGQVIITVGITTSCGVEGREGIPPCLLVPRTPTASSGLLWSRGKLPQVWEEVPQLVPTTEISLTQQK